MKDREHWSKVSGRDMTDEQRRNFDEWRAGWRDGFIEGLAAGRRDGGALSDPEDDPALEVVRWDKR